MGKYGQGNIHAGDWRRRALIALGIFCLLLLIFHRPLLLYTGRKIALHYAAREHLKVEFRLEGSVFTNLTVRNLHAAPTGPSDVESIDVDFARANYGFFTLLRHGISNALQNVEVRSARSRCRLPTATSVALPLLRIASQFFRAMLDVPRMPKRQM